MNNKGRGGEIDLSNPLNWPYLIIYFFVIIVFLGAISQISFDTQCSSVVNEKNVCCSERDQWMNYANSLNETINNCTNLIQEQKDICQNRIDNTTKNCQNKVDIYADFIVVNRLLFVTYNIMLLLFIPLTFNLLKIIFKIGLKKEWEQNIYRYQKGLLIIKIVFWTILTLAIISFFINFLTFNPI